MNVWSIPVAGATIAVQESAIGVTDDDSSNIAGLKTKFTIVI